MTKNFKNFDTFFNSVISKKKIFYQNNITISEDLDLKIDTNNDMNRFILLFI